MTAPRLLLVGDSHLARLGDDIPQLGPQVVNRAVGGAFTTDLTDQVEGLRLEEYDVVVISVGTNDAAPWKHVPVLHGAALLKDFVATIPGAVVLVAPPGVDEARLVRAEDRTNTRMSQHRAAVCGVILVAGGCVVDSPSVLAPLGARAFLADGVHLTPQAYALLLPAVADCISAGLSCAKQTL